MIPVNTLQKIPVPLTVVSSISQKEMKKNWLPPLPPLDQSLLPLMHLTNPSNSINQVYTTNHNVIHNNWTTVFWPLVMELMMKAKTIISLRTAGEPPGVIVATLKWHVTSTTTVVSLHQLVIHSFKHLSDLSNSLFFFFRHFHFQISHFLSTELFYLL